MDNVLNAGVTKNKLFRLSGCMKNATNLEHCGSNEDRDDCVSIFSLECTGLSSPG